MTDRNVGPPEIEDGPAAADEATRNSYTDADVTAPAHKVPQLLVEHGKRIVASGVYAPPLRCWTADELRDWFNETPSCEVINLSAYRQQRAGVADD